MSKSKPYVYRSIDNTLSKARSVMRKHGFNSLPPSDKLTELGYSNLRHAIAKYHGGFPAFRRLLKQELLRREKGKWQDLEYTLSEARSVMETHGFDRLPPGYKLTELEYGGLRHAIEK